MADRCHFCGYRLDGLPDKHNCPECGLTYDRHAEMIVQAASAPRAYMVCGIFGLFFALPVGKLISLNIWPSLLCALVIALGSSGFVLHGWRSLRKPNLAILSVNGLTLIGTFTSERWGACEVWQATWSGIDSICLQRFSSTIEINTVDGLSTLLFSTDLFGSRARAQHFVQRANEWIGKMGGDGDMVTEEGADES